MTLDFVRMLLQVARELEDPFGHQIHQLDLAVLQSHFNDRLWVLTQRKYWRCAASTPLCTIDARRLLIVCSWCSDTGPAKS